MSPEDRARKILEERRSLSDELWSVYGGIEHLTRHIRKAENDALERAARQPSKRAILALKHELEN